ncbi:MAG TPA: hypothetical protein VEF76_01015, partial [Patescibacteria group bacterium]|nr:hypothetical protein [Patescibacteria group bacterium]
KECLKIRSKQGRNAPFTLNAAQRHIHALLEKQLAETGRIRAVILKGRQQGCSTYVEARFYWKVTHHKGRSAFILTHLEEASRGIYQIARRFHDHCPDAVKAKTRISNSKELFFGALDSGYRIGTAKSSGVGRGATLQHFHGSEVAFWTNAAEHMQGALQAVPDAEGTEVILESTSAGPEGLFYKLAQDANSGSSEYQLIFIPWFWQEEYRRRPPADFVATEEERVYAGTFGLDDAQLFWRRQKILTLGGNNVFRREYPATPAEAFHADTTGALWSRDQIEKNRATAPLPEMARVVVAVDPAVSAKKGSDETGIIVAGLGRDGNAYVLADLSGRYAPLDWAQRVVKAYHDFSADRVVAEVNQGGDLVECTLRSIDPRLSYKPVRASRGKTTRAEPVAALDMLGRIRHAGRFERLEDQMCGFDPLQTADSPDRVDARVWAMTELLLGAPPPQGPKVWA